MQANKLKVFTYVLYCFMGNMVLNDARSFSVTFS